MKRILLPIIAAATLLLVGCAGSSDVPTLAYKAGQAYNVAQKGANAYMDVAKPSSEITGKIVGAMDKASPIVISALECAKSIVAAETEGTVPAEASAAGLDADAFVDTQEDVCKDILSRALILIQGVNEAVDKS